MLNICLFCFFVAMVTGVTCCSIFICCDLLGFFKLSIYFRFKQIYFVSLSLSFNHIILICSCMISVCFIFCIHTLILLHIIKVLPLKQFIFWSLVSGCGSCLLSSFEQFLPTNLSGLCPGIVNQYPFSLRVRTSIPRCPLTTPL